MHRKRTTKSTLKRTNFQISIYNNRNKKKTDSRAHLQTCPCSRAAQKPPTMPPAINSTGKRHNNNNNRTKQTQMHQTHKLQQPQHLHHHRHPTSYWKHLTHQQEHKHFVTQPAQHSRHQRELHLNEAPAPLTHQTINKTHLLRRGLITRVGSTRSRTLTVTPNSHSSKRQIHTRIRPNEYWPGPMCTRHENSRLNTINHLRSYAYSNANKGTVRVMHHTTNNRQHKAHICAQQRNVAEVCHWKHEDPSKRLVYSIFGKDARHLAIKTRLFRNNHGPSHVQCNLRHGQGRYGLHYIIGPVVCQLQPDTHHRSPQSQTSKSKPQRRSFGDRRCRSIGHRVVGRHRDRL